MELKVTVVASLKNMTVELVWVFKNVVATVG